MKKMNEDAAYVITSSNSVEIQENTHVCIR